MKNKKIRYLIIFIFIMSVIFISVLLNNTYLNKEILSDSKIKGEIQSGIEFEVYNNQLENSGLFILVNIVDNENGIDTVVLPNSKKISANGKNKMSIDYKISENGDYNFGYTSKSGNYVEKNLKITDEYRDSILKFNFSNTSEYTTNITANITYQDLKDNNIYYKLGENNNWVKYDDSEITISSYDLFNYKNQDNTITVYAKVDDNVGNVVITKAILNNLDLDQPKQPVITFDMKYPKITSRGVGLIDDNAIITYDERDDITNYYSYDNVNWSIYTGQIKADTSEIYAKSVKNKSGLTVSAEKKVAASASNAISPKVYDNNLNSYVSALGTKRIDVDSDMWGKIIKIKWTRSGYDYAGDGARSAYLNAYNQSGKVLASDVRSSTYTILENTAYILFKGTNMGKIYEIYLPE